MSINLNKAKQFDKNQDLKNAIFYYIKAIESNEVFTDEDWLNAGVLFWLTEDYGIRKNYQIDQKIESKAWCHMLNCFNNVNNNESIFWKLYIEHISMGKPSFEKEAKLLLKQNLTPAFYVLYNDQTDEVLKKAKDLYLFCKNKQSERERYIISILDNNLLLWQK